ncbi:MAG TPA: hypothetical protein PK843_12800 [bacterium]|nr:hypothetical protein [bacterium]
MSERTAPHDQVAKNLDERDFGRERLVEMKAFYDNLLHDHKKVAPCFMTGRACVYTEFIDENKRKTEMGLQRLKQAVEKGDVSDFEKYVKENKLEEQSVSGFMIMPFRPNIETFFKNCLEPFFRSEYSYYLELRTASQVKRPGVIICEGICKRIQESPFIVADISVPNNNVFYELGLSFGLRQKILVIYKEENSPENNLYAYQKEIIELLGELKLNRPFIYKGMTPLTLLKRPSEGILVNFSENLWINDVQIDYQKKDSRILLFDLDAKYLPVCTEPAEPERPLRSQRPPRDDRPDIKLDFDEHLMSSVGISINKISAKIHGNEVINYYKSQIENLKTTVNISNKRCHEIKENIDNCYCLIVRTGGKKCHPMAYFWLGYCHAIGKNVIPITCIAKPDSQVYDLAFDIRAQRHITFIKSKPDLLGGEIRDTLELMIRSDFKEWSRRMFWNKIIGTGGEVSIFTGALHSGEHSREMIGDWDLLTVSELTSYFGSHQYRFRIEPPIYPPERAYDRNNTFEKQRYLSSLKDMLRGKNCIIIASPDVNPLTEIVLGQYYGVAGEDLFTDKKLQTDLSPLIVYKEKQLSGHSDASARAGQPGIEPSKVYPRVFYKEEVPEMPTSADNDKADWLRTGFKFSNRDDDKFYRKIPSYFNQKLQKDLPIFSVYANLLILRNTFQNESEVKQKELKENDHYIIVINGVGGPATYAMTHLLTGGVSDKFTRYKFTNDHGQKETFDPHIHSEIVLSEILSKFKEGVQSIECVLKVDIVSRDRKVSDDDRSDGTDQQTDPNAPNIIINDWRRICRWEIVPKCFDSQSFRIN